MKWNHVEQVLNTHSAPGEEKSAALEAWESSWTIYLYAIIAFASIQHFFFFFFLFGLST